MLGLPLFTALLFKVAASMISGNGDTTAEYGEDAHFSCQLENQKGVLQVTWQMLLEDSIENLGSYSNRFGQKVNEPYKEKVIFTKVSLNSTSITVKNVTWTDESCFICAFNAYPGGSQQKKACLTVQGISQVETEDPVIRGGEGGDMAVMFSCSATGRPAPQIQWEVAANATQEGPLKTTTAANNDRTFTSTSNITLRVPPGWQGHAECVLNPGGVGERREKIAFLPTGPEEKEEEEEKGGRAFGSKLVALPVIMVVIVVHCAVLVAVLWWRRSKRGNAQNVL